MSLMKQALLSVLLVVAAAGGWYAYQNAEASGHARETAEGEPASGPRRRRRQSHSRACRRRRRRQRRHRAGRDGSERRDGDGARHRQGGALGHALSRRSPASSPRSLFKPGQTVEAGAPLLGSTTTRSRSPSTARASQYDAGARDVRALADAGQIEDDLRRRAFRRRDGGAARRESRCGSAEIAAGAARRRRRPSPASIGLTDISVGDYVTSIDGDHHARRSLHLRVGFEVPERWVGTHRRGPGDRRERAGAARLGVLRHASSASTTASTRRRARCALEAELANPGERPEDRHGDHASSSSSTTDEQLAVPSLAVQWDRRGSFVWKVVDGAARRAEVAIVRRESGIVIVSGDRRGRRPRRGRGMQRLREGAKVTEVDETPAIVDEGAGGRPHAARAPRRR